VPSSVTAAARRLVPPRSRPMLKEVAMDERLVPQNAIRRPYPLDYKFNE
jgi:hypothetical protein